MAQETSSYFMGTTLAVAIKLNTDTIKLNTDGCKYLTNEKASFEGLFRDQDGRWLLGYYGKMVLDISLETGLWVIY